MKLGSLVIGIVLAVVIAMNWSKVVEIGTAIVDRVYTMLVVNKGK